MSRNLLQYTTCIPLQNIADRIVLEQTQSIVVMQEALPHCEQLTNPEQELRLYQRCFQQITQTMFIVRLLCDKSHQCRFYPRNDPASQRGDSDVGKRPAVFHLSGAVSDSGRDYQIPAGRYPGDGEIASAYEPGVNPGGSDSPARCSKPCVILGWAGRKRQGGRLQSCIRPPCLFGKTRNGRIPRQSEVNPRAVQGHTTATQRTRARRLSVRFCPVVQLALASVQGDLRIVVGVDRPIHAAVVPHTGLLRKQGCVKR